MLPRTWFRSSHRLLGSFLAITLVPSVFLLALGWRLLVQDRALHQRQVTERREQAADLVVAALDQQLTTVERSLADPDLIRTLASTTDAVAVVFDGGVIQAFPSQRLSYYPESQRDREAPHDAFLAGEQLEVQARDPRRAAEWFREHTRSPDAAIRAGALIGWARNLRKIGSHESALVAYAAAAEIRGVAVAGRPADLLARWAQCDLLASLKQQDRLRHHASALNDDLRGGRWRLDRATTTCTPPM